MKVLLSAIACHPEQGSEGGVGWKAALAIAKCHEVHVLTSSANRAAIEQALAGIPISNLTFTYFGKDERYHENRLVARIQSWLRYFDWTKQSLIQARQLSASHTFHIVHHVTYSTWRVPSPLWQLGSPLVWGPVGGAGVYPSHLLPNLSFHSAAFEILRSFSNKLASQSVLLRRCTRNAAAVVASNQETFERLLQLRDTERGMHMLFPTFFTDKQITMFRCNPADKPLAEPIRLFAGGNIIGSKGLIFALEALKIAAQQGVNWRLVVGGYGPEIPFLKKRAHALGIDEWVDFHMGFSGEEYAGKLKESHIFILPSFRENAGITMLEAMLAGCVPVIVDASAQAGMVNEDCGFKIPITAANEISQRIADALITLTRDPALRVAMGTSAAALVARTCREENYTNSINRIYQQVVQPDAHRRQH